MNWHRKSCAAWQRFVLRVLVSATVLGPSSALAQPIDLSLLFHESGAPIAIAAAGTSAVFTEDPTIFSVFLSNIPGLGDPELVSGGPAKLSFDYDFRLGAGDADIFHFALLDGLSGAVLAPFEFFLDASGSGSISFDLTTLGTAVLGLQFELTPDIFNDTGLGALLTVANLRIESTEPPVPADEPGAALLLLAMAGAIATRRARSRAHEKE